MLLPTGNPIKCPDEVMSLEPMIPPKLSDIDNVFRSYKQDKHNTHLVHYTNKKEKHNNNFLPLTGWMLYYIE